MNPMEVLQMMQQAIQPLQSAITSYAATGAELKGKLETFENMLQSEIKRLHNKDVEHDEEILVLHKALSQIDGFKDAFKAANNGTTVNVDASSDFKVENQEGDINATQTNNGVQSKK